MEATAALLVRSHISILGGQPAFEQPGTILGTELEAIECQMATRRWTTIRTYTSLPVKGLGHQHEGR